MKQYRYPPPPSPPLAKLAPLLLLAAIAWPAQAQQLAPLVIPGVNGTEACTDGGLTELRDTIFNVPNNVRNSLTISITPFNAGGFTTFFSMAVPSEGIPLSVGVKKNERGASNTILPADTMSLGTLRSDSPIAAQSFTFSNLDKSTRYVVGIIRDGSFISRRCFKTHGEFTNAEQNLVLSGSTWRPNLAQYNRTGCYAVASTRQDIRDCYCNGTRGGTHILAGQTVASQAQRQYLNCPDLDS